MVMWPPTMEEIELMVRGALVIRGAATIQGVREGIWRQYGVEVEEWLVIAALGAGILAGDIIPDSGLGTEPDHIRHDVRDTFRRAYMEEHARWSRLGVLRKFIR